MCPSSRFALVVPFRPVCRRNTRLNGLEVPHRGQEGRFNPTELARQTVGGTSTKAPCPANGQGRKDCSSPFTGRDPDGRHRSFHAVAVLCKAG